MKGHGIDISPRTFTKSCVAGWELAKRIKMSKKDDPPPKDYSPQDLVTIHSGISGLRVSVFVTPHDQHVIIPDRIDPKTKEEKEPKLGSLKKKFNAVEIDLNSDPDNPKMEIRAYLETRVEIQNSHRARKIARRVQKIGQREKEYNKLLEGCAQVITFKRSQEEMIVEVDLEGKIVEYPLDSSRQGIRVWRQSVVAELFDLDLLDLINDGILLRPEQVMKIVLDLAKAIRFIHSKDIPQTI